MLHCCCRLGYTGKRMGNIPEILSSIEEERGKVYIVRLLQELFTQKSKIILGRISYLIPKQIKFYIELYAIFFNKL